MFRFTEVDIQKSQDGTHIVISGPYDPVNDCRDIISIPLEMVPCFIEQLDFVSKE